MKHHQSSSCSPPLQSDVQGTIHIQFMLLPLTLNNHCRYHGTAGNKKAFPRVNTRPENMAREKQWRVCVSEWARAPSRCTHTGRKICSALALLPNYPAAEKDLFHALSTPEIGQAASTPSPKITVHQRLMLKSHCRITQPVSQINP